MKGPAQPIETEPSLFLVHDLIPECAHDLTGLDLDWTPSLSLTVSYDSILVVTCSKRSVARCWRTCSLSEQILVG